jgi:GT2 family glycosyltransferase
MGDGQGRERRVDCDPAPHPPYRGRMPRSVTVLLVAADGADYLRQTLEAIRAQTRPPDQLVVAQLGSSPVTAGIVDRAKPTAHVRVPARSGFGDALAAGAKAARTDAGGDDEWLWLLATDNAPEPDALEQLLRAVDLAPSVAVAGPKQMQWDAPDYLRSFGETMTRYGGAVELAEPELDQAQYDRQSDVLGVAAGGMLVRAELWWQLGGFDPALPAVDDALDFCVRARLAGHRVQLVPAARVRSGGVAAPGTRLLGITTPPARRARLARQAQLHRRLVYAPLLAVVPHWLSIVPLGLLRALGQLLRKRPGAAPAELLAAGIVLVTCFAPVIRARGRLSRTRTVGWAAVAPLRISGREVRHRRALVRENGRPTRHRLSAGFAGGGGLATVGAAAAVSIVLNWPLLGAPQLVGGALLPVGDLTALWGAVGWGWHPIGQGFFGPADPFALVLAALGTVTFWHPATAIALLWIGALPLAAFGGWLAAAAVTRRPALRIVGAIVWAAAPTVLVSLNAGRIGAVLVHLALPFAMVAAISARRSTTAAALLALLGALIAASAPSLLPLLALGWAAGVVAPALRGRPPGTRLLLVPLPTLVLFTPLALEQARYGSPLGLLADPGPVVPPAGHPALLGLPEPVVQALQLGAGWPDWLGPLWSGLATPLGQVGDAAVLFVWAMAAPLALLALAGLLWPRRSAPLPAALALAGGVLAAVLATKLQVLAVGTERVPAWPGAALSVAWLGLVAAALHGLDRLSASGELPFGNRLAAFTASVRRVATTVIGIAATAALLVAGSPLLVGTLLGTSAVHGGTGETVPAIVSAKAQSAPHLGMLSLTPQPDGGVREHLSRGAGDTLEGTSTLHGTAAFGEGETLTDLAAALVQPSGEDLGPVLRRLQIGFVLLQPGNGSVGSAATRSEAAAALGTNPALSPVGITPSGTLYRYVGAPSSLGVAPLDQGPGNTATPLGLAVLLVQLVVLGVALLLALPTGRVARQLWPEPPLVAPPGDVAATHAAHRRSEPRRALAPEQAMARDLLRREAEPEPEPQPEPVRPGVPA